MLNLPSHSELGKDLKSARKSQCLTQAALANKSGLSIPSIRLLEKGRGNLESLRKVIASLDLVLKGRNLPAAESVGERIAILRKRQGHSQRAFADMIGITQPTLVELEKRSCGRMDTLERALIALKTGARLVSRNTPISFYAEAGNSSAHHGWTTPKSILESLYSVFGAFDLDPCSPSHDRRSAPVRASVYYTVDDDGLSLPWFGSVFVNPPYGRTLRKWTNKAKSEVAVGNARVIVALIPSRTDCSWWHLDIAGSAAVFFLRGRLCFGDSGQPAPFPSALVIWGGTSTELEAIRAALPNAWNP